MPSNRTYWVDRCLGTRIVPTRLRDAGIGIRTYDELYPSNSAVPDTEWIPQVAARGWVILTKDKRIRRSPHEVEALRRARAIYVCLAAGELSGDEQAACLLHH